MVPCLCLFLDFLVLKDINSHQCHRIIFSSTLSKSFFVFTIWSSFNIVSRSSIHWETFNLSFLKGRTVMGMKLIDFLFINTAQTTASPFQFLLELQLPAPNTGFLSKIYQHLTMEGLVSRYIFCILHQVEVKVFYINCGHPVIIYFIQCLVILYYIFHSLILVRSDTYKLTFPFSRIHLFSNSSCIVLIIHLGSSWAQYFRILYLNMNMIL